jgi:predicted dehydrogenase
MHADMAIQALDAGKHVLVEKPVDIRVDKIRKLAEKAEKTGLKAACVFQSRTDPLNKRIRQAVKDGRLGKLVGVHATLPWYRKQSYYQGPHGAWKGTWDMDGGGSLMNQGIHTVDLLQWIAGPVASVFGKFGVFAHDIEAEDKTVATLAFENGALGTLTTTTAAYGGVLNRSMLFHGDQGTIYVADGLRGWKLVCDENGDEEKQMMAFYGAKDLKPQGETVATDPMSVGSTGHRFHVEDLADAIRNNREPDITVQSAMHSVQIANAIYASARCGHEIDVREGKPLTR